ncbi:MAG: YibE/F family protein [Chloroflexi bacterium]|nr:YibE/F family protein [Chloroflexota bacterium]HEV8054564.1 YibE/F family protein [Candidatus Limnocylindrales bacterium]
MDGSLLRRVGATVPALLIGSTLVVGLWLMPDLTPSDAIPVVGQRSDHGRIVASLGADPTGLPRFEVEVDDGARIEAVVQDGSAAIPGSSNREPYEVGDEVVVTSFSGPAAGISAVISEPWRIPLLGTVAAVFAVAVLVVGGLRGIRSLVALALTLTVIVRVVVPLLLRGFDPILLAVVVAAAVTLATLLLTEGFSRVTLAAVLGTFAALAMTAGLAAAFTAGAAFTALQGNEEIAFLIPLVGDRIDLNGILLAATVFGALGVLDDVTVTQAATVDQLHRAEPAAGRAGVIARAMRVGRSHIAATVNTLVLAYLGAGLPLLLLFALSGQSPLLVLNGEIVAVEVIRALVGSIGIVAAVPLTTLVAALLMVPARTPADAA